MFYCGYESHALKHIICLILTLVYINMVKMLFYCNDAGMTTEQ